MEEAVVGAVVGATVQVVIQNLITVSAKEIKLVRDFKKDLEKLRNTLDMIQDVLYRAELQQVTDRDVKRWLKKLEDVAFEADNVLDEFHYHLLRKESNKDRQTTMKKKVKSILSCSNFRSHRLKLGHKIRDINKELESINREAEGFGLQMRLAGAHAPAAGSDASFVGLQTDSFTIDPIFIGRDDDVSRIVEMLTSSTSEQVFSILPIVGMGGLGKTTLTRKVFKHEKIKTHFGTTIWVHVSTNFDPVSLLKKILTTLTPGNDQVGSREVILKMLHEALKDKTYLLVLDDVWNQELHKWEDFINSLSGICSSKGNGIVVTTRNTEVASIVKTLDIHQLNSLSKEDCWSIIKAKTFGEGYISPEFETSGRNIAKRCQGLPLAANVVGGVLRGKSKEQWLSIEKNWLPHSEGDESSIQKILKLSFDNLPSPSLKKCFAYSSIFPKGKLIKKQTLIELWMAERFLQDDQGYDMETVGNNVFNLLLRNSLLQVTRTDDIAGVISCNMHDLVHDLAFSILGSAKVDDIISNGIHQIRYIGCNYDGDESTTVSEKEAKCLRTLFFNGEISKTMFSYFECLHVLTLRGDRVEELPISIGELIHLRYLDISCEKIQFLPDSIGELYHLQTLCVYKLRKLPYTVKYLNALRHLHICSDMELPPEIGRLTFLQTLPYFKVRDDKGCGIAELGSLQNLKGKLEICNLEKVCNKEEAKNANLFQKPNIVELVLQWNKSTERETNDENVLEGLQPHPNLKSLKIEGFRGKKFPLWTSKMVVQDKIANHWVELNNLMRIALESCEECEELPMLGHLPNLKSLSLNGLTNVRSIGSSFYGMDNDGGCKEMIIVFPLLERLELCNMPNLTKWAEVEISSAAETQPREVKVFPCLGCLVIHDCEELTSAPSHFPCLKGLDVWGMKSGLPLANICGIKLTSLTKLTIGLVDGLVCLPDGLFYNNQNLSELTLQHCSKVIELPDGLHTLNSLQELKIMDCPNLKSIPYGCPSGGQSQGLTSLRSLQITNCKELINLPICRMLESCAWSLEDLSLMQLRSGTNFAMVIDSLQNIPRVAKLEIDTSVLQFSPSPMGINLRNICGSLRILHIGPCPDSSSNYDSFNKTADWILQGGLRSLRELQLRGDETLGLSPRSASTSYNSFDIVLN